MWKECTKLTPKCWRTSIRSIKWRSWMNFRNVCNLSLFFRQCYYWWRNVSIWVDPGKSYIVPNGTPHPPPNKRREKLASQKREQCWLSYLTLRVLSRKSKYIQDRPSMLPTTLMFSIEWATCFLAATWVIHHDNAPSYIALRICEFLTEPKFATLSQAAYTSN